MIGKLLCKLPRWLGGGHKWRRLTKKERNYAREWPLGTDQASALMQMRICRRWEAERIVKPRKPKVTKETT